MSKNALTLLRVFTEDDDDFLNKDIYVYIKKYVFKEKADDDIVIKDVSDFFEDQYNVEGAISKLDLNIQDFLIYIIKYFNKHSAKKYHPLALAKKIKTSIDNYD